MKVAETGINLAKLGTLGLLMILQYMLSTAFVTHATSWLNNKLDRSEKILASKRFALTAIDEAGF